MQTQTPRKSLNKAYLKQKIQESNIKAFAEGLNEYLDQINEQESEEHHKSFLGALLQQAGYGNDYLINTHENVDFVIHAGKKATDHPGVLIETKRPGNKNEMPAKDNLKAKAIYELILYYLRERIEHENNHIKHLVATDFREWYIFDENEFDKLIFRDASIKKEYENFKTSNKDNPHFYSVIAPKIVEKFQEQVAYTYLNLDDYKNIAKKQEPDELKKLIPVYKLLSPAHLLKQPFINDSNQLDRGFYNELLHIIGLEEHKKGSQKLIQRKPEANREAGSIIENTMTMLRVEGHLAKLSNRKDYGETEEEQLFGVALELVIIWINRVLFIKLLEAQLVNYNNDPSYKFLHIDALPDYDALNKLFFQVLAFRPNDRPPKVRPSFDYIPYLNSSLFETTDLEGQTLRISNLEDEYDIAILSNTVLKDNQGKKRKGKLDTLRYLFDFLDAYDFSSEGSEEIQQENKKLINASVLGLIFEKINGYKDGSFFTPGFITEYMARETVRRAVVQKFNEHQKKDYKDFDDLKDRIDISREGREEANSIINSLKICDPAVGSGHFLVSVLNEMITVKSELGVFNYRDGDRIKSYTTEVENDELIVKDEDDQLFEYHHVSNPKAETQRIQEALFHEKQTIIEGCLFGVDINQNSVNICHLRLWIELLKNAYYTPESNYTQLETLPNIDINIKCGNSLISRFPLDASLGKALRQSSRKWNLQTYRIAVHNYKNAQDKTEKQELERLIKTIKSDFRTEIKRDDKDQKALAKLENELYDKYTGNKLFREKLTGAQKKDFERINKDIEKIKSRIKDKENNQIYQHAFEWRFEFPEVLNDEGDFVGFDVVIGNPPYIRQEGFSKMKDYLKNNYKIFHSIADLLTYFVELGHNILKKSGIFQFIISNKFTRTDYGKVMRNFLLENTSLTNFIDFSGLPVFDEATVDAAVLGYMKKRSEASEFIYADILKSDFQILGFYAVLRNASKLIKQDTLSKGTWVFLSEDVLVIKQKVESQGIPLKDWDINFNYGIKTGFNDAFVLNNDMKNLLIQQDSNSKNAIKPFLRGRDIQKYVPDYQNLWLIATFPSLKINIDDYFAIKNHFMQFGKRLEQTGEKGCRKKTSNKWYETQDNIAYWQDFQKPKIIFPNMTKYLPFVIDIDDNYLHNDKSFHIVSHNIYWLGSFFNSKLFKYCFKDNFAELLGGTRELRKVFFEPIPVKFISEEAEKPFKEKILEILKIKKSNPSIKTVDIENEIDQMVYDLYGLTEEERRIVEESEG